jgi:hypothetical protein
MTLRCFQGCDAAVTRVNFVRRTLNVLPIIPHDTRKLAERQATGGQWRYQKCVLVEFGIDAVCGNGLRSTAEACEVGDTATVSCTTSDGGPDEAADCAQPVKDLSMAYHALYSFGLVWHGALIALSVVVL